MTEAQILALAIFAAVAIGVLIGTLIPPPSGIDEDDR